MFFFKFRELSVSNVSSPEVLGQKTSKELYFVNLKVNIGAQTTIIPLFGRHS